ncbi:MAG: ABC transporter substrate-binding protein [Chloroflexi bacterium]|nr:ABC transporter substrate-binding protein [Chloroflexota bacterium]
MRTRVQGMITLLALSSLVLAACGRGTVVTQPQAVQTQIVSVPGPVVQVTATPVPTQPVAFNAKDPTSFTQLQTTQPDTLDPTLSASAAGQAIIQNVYDTLISYRGDSLTDFVPQLAEQVPSQQNGGISADGRTYTFTIRQGVKFHNGDSLTAADVAYTFQRLILQGGSSSPQWLVFEPVMGSTPNNDITDLIVPNGPLLDSPQNLADVNPRVLEAVCQMVQRAVSFDSQANTVTFHLAQAWAPFLAILTGPYASIEDQNWVAQNGGWDGNCNDWQKYYGRTLDEESQTLLGTGENGTGPYLLDHWTAGKEIVLKANLQYWRTQPAWAGGPSGAPAIKTVTIQFIKSFTTRSNLFKSGNADELSFLNSKDASQLEPLAGEVCDVQTNRCDATEVSGSSILAYTGMQDPSRMDAFFNFDINTQGAGVLVGSGQLDGNGIPSYFFTDVHIRQAFSYCFNWDAYIQQTQQRNASQAYQVMPPGEIGSSPDNPHYSYDPAACTAAFKASTWRGTSGKSLWDTGFLMGIAYNPRNPDTQAFAEILSQDIAAVNNKFVVQVTSLPWTIYQDDYHNKRLPIYFPTTQETLADPHYWADTYTTGKLGAGLQRMPRYMVYQFQLLVGSGVKPADPAARALIYQKFNQLYYDLAPSILLVQGYNQRYMQRWVQGYFYNPANADLLYYYLSMK